MSSASSSSSVEHLDQVLQLLSDVSAVETGDKLQQLAKEALKSVGEMRTELLGSTPLGQLARIVEKFEWEKAAEQLKNNFLPVDRPDVVKQVLLQQPPTNDDIHCYHNTIKCRAVKWVKYLDVELHPVVCETLYNSMKLKGHTDQLPVLKLLKYVRKFAISIQDDLRSELEKDSRCIIDQIVEDIKQKTCKYQHHRQLSLSSGGVKFFMPSIVRQFDLRSLKSILLLFNFSEMQNKNYNSKFSFYMINTLLEALEEHLLMDSLQALHLWAHIVSVKWSIQGRRLWSLYRDTLKLFDTPLEKLTKMKSRLLVHYQPYIEDQHLTDLLKNNPLLLCILPDFIKWYYNGDSERTKNLMVAATILEGERVLNMLH